jgi:hypothetical protein
MARRLVEVFALVGAFAQILNPVRIKKLIWLKADYNFDFVAGQQWLTVWYYPRSGYPFILR